MAGQAKPMRASRISSGARTEGSEHERDRHPLSPFWALVGASLPWLVYDALIKNPEDFWTSRGVIVLAAVALGVILVGLAWHYSRGLSDGGEEV
jgi:hypothetical protein